ncbi:MAG: hypothetical protein U1F10_08555 [Burkholderiales bacterium]
MAMPIPILVLLAPLLYGQGWIGEVVMILLPFRNPPSGIAYFIIPSTEQTRVFNSLPFALALLTSRPEWAIGGFIVSTWILTAAITYLVARRLFPEDPRLALLAFYIAGTSAYDISLLQTAYLPLFMAALLHWVGLLLLLQSAECRSRARLLASSLLQLLSLFTYANAVAAIALGPAIAYAICRRRTTAADAYRSARAAATAWWPPLAAYLAALAWVAQQPGNYITSLGGLRFEPSWKLSVSVMRLFAENFNFYDWVDFVPFFGNAPRIISFGVSIVVTTLSAAAMLFIVSCGREAKEPGVERAGTGLLIAALLAAVLASNFASSLIQLADINLRTHLVSRLYAAVIIAAACAKLLRSRKVVVLVAGGVLTSAYIGVGAWTLVDHANYLVSQWPRFRAELQSLDDVIRHVDPDANVVLYVPPGSGYIATVAPWHARPWGLMMRRSDRGFPAFVHWSPDRGSGCTLEGSSLACIDESRNVRRILVAKTVVVHYDPHDCRIKVVTDRWMDNTISLPADYQPRRWLRESADEPTELIQKLLYAPVRASVGDGCP